MGEKKIGVNIEKSLKDRIIINNKKYFDLSLNSGVLFLGHNHMIFKNLLRALISNNYSLSNFSNNLKKRIYFLLKIFFKNTHRVIYCTTGSESVIKALRISRAIKKDKKKIIMVSGSWHGSVSETLFAADNKLVAKPLSAGLKKSDQNLVSFLPYNDIFNSKKILNRNKSKINCIIVEPIMGSLPLNESKKYLKFLDQYSKKNKILLIFDEIITGFRTEKGSVQNKFNLKPDITLIGKIMGGGYPISAILISRKVSNKIDKLSKKIFFGGTFSGNNYSLLSCYKILNYLKDMKFTNQTILKTSYIQKKINNFINRNNLGANVFRFDSFLRIIFSDKMIKNRISRDFLEKKNKEKITNFRKFLFKKKILYPNNGIIFISNVSSYNDINKIIKIICLGLKKYFSVAPNKKNLYTIKR